jgi:hypothetical protein
MMLHASLWRIAMKRSACLAGIGVLSACTTVSNVDSRQVIGKQPALLT